MFSSLLDSFRGKPIDYEEAKRQARHKDVKVRLKLAKRHDVMPEILYFLAEDPAPEVRRAIANNPSTPHQAHQLLLRDNDDGVRFNLAGKIASLVPELGVEELAAVREAAHEVLMALARDQATRVRRILSETLRDIADAPPDLINKLARDVELVVCAPVLEFSPVLTDQDLLDIINSSPVKGALSAVSRRKAVSEPVSDAITDAGDPDAIGDLLANPTAQIREDTLDRIIEDSRDRDAWHDALANRPRLSRRAVLKLAEFVAEHLVLALSGRRDLDPGVVEAVHEEFSRRMEAAERTRAKHEGGPPEERVQRLFAQNRLNDQSVREAAQSGDRSFVVAALALLSHSPKAAVNTVVVDLATPKGVLALCWKAGLDVETAVIVQKRIARIPPREVLGSARGTYPLSVDEMEWQLDFVMR
ncbi:MAG: DUF2336 domain-containing protein [Alphaproteobacteria bacterium]|nr:DUF2336 domain-containing protein [Alphaproteobacteria bacterium]MBF0250157.1 DUF2336 domain-containing protein [Alphaproteobacteria bacterium]